MNTGQLFKVDSQLLSRDQVVALARRAALTADDLANPKPVILKDTPFERHIERADGRVVRLVKVQDTKYGVLWEPVRNHPSGEGNIDGALANLTTGMPIPDDEPVMIFRGQDRHALAAIETYCRTVTNEGTSIDEKSAPSAGERFMAFQTFAIEHPERMKDPT